MSKQPSTVQTTQNTTQTLPQYVTDAQQGLLGTGRNVYDDFYNATPNYGVAGFNADQLAGFDLTRQVAQNTFANTPSLPSWYGQAAPSMPTAAYTYGGMSAAPNFYTGASMNAAQVGGADIQGLMNPFTQSVIDPTLAQMRQGHDATSAQIGAQSAAAGSFGGSREGLRQGQNDRALGEQTALTTAQMNSQAYQQAAALAQANAQMRQAADQFNASSQNQSNQTNVASANAANQFNAGVNNTANQFNSTQQNARDQFIASLGLQGRSQDLQAAQLQNTFANDAYQRQMAAVAAMLGIGATEKQQLQNIIDQPRSALSAYAGMVPQQIPVNSSSVGTAPNTAPGLGQQLLGGGLSLLGLKTAGGGSIGGSLLGSLFCDARLKKDIVPHGVSEGGRPLFAFRYKWEGDDAPLTIGPMAQIEELHDPDSVIELLGIKLVVTRH